MVEMSVMVDTNISNISIVTIITPSESPDHGLFPYDLLVQGDFEFGADW